MRKECCKHFNGILEDSCRAGVRYDDVTPRPNDTGSALRLPCMRRTLEERERGGEKGSCDKLEYPSDEEVAAGEAAVLQAMERMAKTLPLISRIKEEHEGEDWQGVETCPVCDGKLHMSHAAYNGHVWGRCETEDCVSWME